MEIEDHKTMARFRFGTTFAAAILATAAAWGQAVQLPTYSYFGTGTVVSVPDRGSVYTAGVNRAASGISEFGTPLLPFRNRSIGSERSASSVWTSVYIHDFEAMEEDLLSHARGSSGQGLASRTLPASSMATAGHQLAPRSGAAPRATWQARQAPRPATGPLVKSIAELQAERAGEQQARIAEARDLFERGRAAEQAGKANVARIYYQQASRRAAGPLKEQILAQLAMLTATPLAQR